VSPNGQAVIRDSVIDSFLRVATPWTAAATSSRHFDSTLNRLWEYNNSGPGAAPDGSAGAAGAPDAG
jgi:pectinesterase